MIRVPPSKPVPMPTPQRVDLRNCVDEPIHIPGSIQPHGVLIFLDGEGRIEGWSANIDKLPGVAAPDLGQTYAMLGLPGAVAELLQEAMGAAEDGESPSLVAAVTMGDKEYDCVVHVHQGRIVVEFE